MPEIETWYKKIPTPKRTLLSRGIVSLATITLAVSLFFNLVIDTLYRTPWLPRLGLAVNDLFYKNATELAPLFNKYTLTPLRLFLFYLWFSALYLVVKRNELLLKKWLGWLLIPFGQNSLYVYIVHSFIVFFINLILPLQGKTAVIANISINSAVLAIIWIMVKKKVLFTIIPR